MVCKELYVERYDWIVHTFFDVDESCAEEIMDVLFNINCSAETARVAFDKITSGKKNVGLCFTNYKMRESVLVVSKSTSSAEFINSLHHELVHLPSHIAHECNLDPQGEEIAYLSGDIIMRIYPHVAYLLCDKCRNKYLDYEKE